MLDPLVHGARQPVDPTAKQPTWLVVPLGSGMKQNAVPRLAIFENGRGNLARSGLLLSGWFEHNRIATRE